MTIPGAEEPTLDEVLDITIQACATELRVAMPGRVTKYNESKREVDVQPLIMRRGIDEPKPTNLPVLANVPVMFPQTSKGVLLLPIAAGDPVTLIVSDRDLSAWKAGKDLQPTEPNSIRKHNLSDCWAYPGGWPGAKPFTPAASGAMAMQVVPGTPIYIGNGTDELLQIASNAFTSMKDLADQLKQTLADIQLLTVLSASPGNPSSVPVNAASFATIDLTVDTIVAGIEDEIASLGNIKT